MKKWRINTPDPQTVGEIMKKTDLSRLCAEVLVSRGLSDITALEDFFNGDELSDPFLLCGMEEAVQTISKAAEGGELICVYGDYDCDGITATAVLYGYLNCMGANVCYYIPERDEGYGINKDAVDKLRGAGVNLIVTVDNGISAVLESEYIYECGIKLVVTDHHRPSEFLPKAEAIVDPWLEDCFAPFKSLAGVGVALKLCCALDGGDYTMVMEQYSELAAIGTIADIVPLTHENRIIVRNGLNMLKITENQGLAALIEICGIDLNKLDAKTVAFSIAPRINAAGRFGSPLYALEMLINEDESAQESAYKLDDLNSQRKKCEEKIISEIYKYLSENPKELERRVLVISGKGWHHGVVGIVASKLLEKFGKPVVLISVDEDKTARGSARSIKGFNIFKCFEYCSDLLIRFGGHEGAGGLTVNEDNISALKSRIQEYAKNNCQSMPTITLTADKVLCRDDFSVEQAQGLSVLEPFGEENPVPLFAMLGARLDKIVPLANGKHQKLVLSYDGIKTECLLFGVSSESFIYSQGDTLDLLVNLSVSTFKGSKSLGIVVKDFRRHGFSQDRYFAAKDTYEAYKRGEELSFDYLNRIIPQREELVALYKLIDGRMKKPFDADTLYMRTQSKTMNYCKMRICLDIFTELGLTVCDNDSGTYSAAEVKARADLDKSKILSGLKGMINSHG